MKKRYLFFFIKKKNTGDLLYVSNQDSNTVSFYNASTQSYLGSIENVGSPRGLAFDQVKNYLYICAPTYESVFVLDSNQKLVSTIHVKDPISVTLDVKNGLAYISNADKNNERVEVYETTKFSKTMEFKTDGGELRHPTGSVIIDDKLYVLSQEKSLLLSFSIPTQQYLGVLSTFSSTPEQIAFVNFSC